MPSKSKPIQNKTGTYLYEKDIPQTIIDMSVPAFDRQDTDYYAFQVFNYILGGGGFGSRLMEKIREQEGLTYGIYSYGSFLNDVQNFQISTSTQNDKVETLLGFVHKEISKIKDTPVEEKELQSAKDYLTGSLYLSMTSTEKISGVVLGLLQNDRPINYLDQYRDKINAITTEDIQRVAKRILNKDAFTTVLVGKPTIDGESKKLNSITSITDIPNVE